MSRCLLPTLGLLLVLMPGPSVRGEEAAQSFARFASQRLDALWARAERARTRPDVRPGADAPLITYRSIGQDFEASVEATGDARVPFVGVLQYTELVYSCEDTEAQECVEVASNPVTELYRLRDGTWGY